MSLGKLRHTLKEKCPDCGTNLQLRVHEVDAVEEGEEIVIGDDYIVCPDCGFEQPYDKKRDNRRSKKKRERDDDDWM